MGLVGMAVWVAFHVGVATLSRHDLDRFAALKVEAAQPATPSISPFVTKALASTSMLRVAASDSA